MSTQAQLHETLTWEKAYTWAKEHDRASWLRTNQRYENIVALGLSANPLFCPLACFINESIDDGTDWRVRYGMAIRYEYDHRAYYDLPAWAGQAELLVDEHGDHVSITQEMFLAILEQVRPQSEVEA